MGVDKQQIRERARRDRLQKFIPSNFNVILKAPEIQAATGIASYISYETEPSTEEINQAFLRSGKKLYLPRINGDLLEWVNWNGEQSSLRAKKKILEPTGDAIADLSVITAIVVPALRIDQSGFRLGQGGGFYDRALAQVDAWTIALIFPEEISGQPLPREDHDIPVNAYATHDMVVRLS